MTDELEAIRARHEVTEHDWWPAAAGVAHADRATLLRLLDAAREELREVKEAASETLEWLQDPKLNTWPYMANRGPGTFYPDLNKHTNRLAAALKEPPLTRAQGESS